MSEVTTEAVVLGRTEIGESDRVITLFSRDLGKVSALAKGARKSGSRLGGVSEPLVRARFTLAIGRRRPIVTSFQPMTSHPKLRVDFLRLSGALAVVELCDNAAPSESPSPEVFDWLVEGIGALEVAENVTASFVWSAARLLDVEGIRPSWTRHAATGAALDQNPAWISASAGGHLSEGASESFRDAFLAPAEALLALERIGGREEPPSHLIMARECAIVVARYWQDVIGRRLTATDAFIEALRSA